MNARITITDNGWFASLPAATQDFVMRNLIKNEVKHGWSVKFADQRGKEDIGVFLTG